MRESKTATQILKNLENQGFYENFMADENGLYAIKAKIVISPKDIVIKDFFRLEGETDLDEENIIFALSCPKHNILGVYNIAFGPKMSDLDTKIVAHLKKNMTNIKK